MHIDIGKEIIVSSDHCGALDGGTNVKESIFYMFFQHYNNVVSIGGNEMGHLFLAQLEDLLVHGTSKVGLEDRSCTFVHLHLAYTEVTGGACSDWVASGAKRLRFTKTLTCIDR
jgi:hypothetical protein